MRSTILGGAAALAAITAAPAEAQNRTLCYKAHGVREAVVNKQGKEAPGRNICRYGLRNGDKASTHQKAKYLRQLERLNAPTHHTLLARVAVAPAQSPAGTLTASVRGVGAGGSSNPNVNPQCESGGNPQVYDRSGKYWGKYQFDKTTWERFGGTNYGHASEAEQDAVAARVTYDAWPNC